MISTRLGKSETLQLFVTVAFPVHFWAILVFLLSSPNVDNFKAIGEAIGIGSYILLFALFESAIVTLFFLILSFLFPKKFGKKKVLSVMLSLIWLVVFWTLVGNFLGLLTNSYDALTGTGGINLPTISLSDNSVVSQVIAILAVISPFVAFQLGKHGKIGEILITISEQIKPITYLYLFTDVLAFVISLARNVG